MNVNKNLSHERFTDQFSDITIQLFERTVFTLRVIQNEVFQTSLVL